MLESDKKIDEVLLQGYNDEITAALDYINLAHNYGNIAIKKAFLNYAIEEINHSVRLLQVIEQNEMAMPKGSINKDEVVSNMVEYIAHEDSAIFYYDVLKNLSEDENIVEVCTNIKKEEERHLKSIKEILAKVNKEA